MNLRKSILALDDSEVVLGALSVVLSRAGYAVDTAINAGDAFTILALQPVDLMIVDLQIPSVSGFDFLTTVRRRRLSDAPALMLTASEEITDIKRARDLGAIGFFSKPFDGPTLLAKVHRILTAPELVWIDDHHSLVRGGESEHRPMRLAASK